MEQKEKIAEGHNKHAYEVQFTKGAKEHDVGQVDTREPDADMGNRRHFLCT